MHAGDTRRTAAAGRSVRHRVQPRPREPFFSQHRCDHSMAEASPARTRPPAEHVDVLVVGAGPAGSTAARRLAEAGLDVRIIEKRAVVGHPAQCGECIPEWTEMLGTYPQLAGDTWLEDCFAAPDHVRLQPLEWLRLFTPSMHAYGMELHCFAAHRPQYDGWLADRAISAGARLDTATPLTNILHRGDGPDVHITPTGRITADQVIDASGALAHVARLRGQGQRPPGLLPTIYAQVTGPIPETFDVFLGSVAPGGYAWIIPKGDHANVGLGVRSRDGQTPLKAQLQAFCDQLGFTVEGWGGGWIPMDGPVRQAVTDHVLAVGDAAGMVMASNGGGIGQAIVSGKQAADAILAHRRDGTPLAAYDAEWRRTMLGPLRISKRTKDLGWMLFRHDAITEPLLRMLGPLGGLRRAMECKRPLWVL